MKLLLDTHILLWVMQDEPRLGRAARRVLNEAEAVHVSSVSLWEIAIKRSLGKLRIDEETLDTQLDKIGFAPLPITWAHTRAVRRLPLLHTDPFDRMLVAQAQVEDLTVVTGDPMFERYGVSVLEA